MAHFGDLAALAAKLRADGLDVRNLGQVGITLWNSHSGYFFPAAELEENEDLVARRDFAAILARRDGEKPIGDPRKRHPGAELRLAS